jgi:flagellar biosynthesis/type III secretory pathway protein FliH
MSTNAQRLEATVATERFDWQRRLASHAPPPTLVIPVFASIPAAENPNAIPALRELPSPSVERLAAAEQEAFTRGYAEGERDGLRALADRTDAFLARLGETIENVASLRLGMLHRAEREAVRLALAMAEQIVRREVDRDPTLLVSIARKAIERLGETTVANIHLHPDDLAAARLEPGVLPGSSVTLAGDPSLTRGSCVIRSSFGTIDAGIDAQIRELSRAMLDPDTAEEPADDPFAG